jgi:hypothetical protein
MSDRRLALRTLERFGLPKPSPIQVDKTFFVEKCPLDFPPHLVAHHVLRAAVQAGCSVISVRRGHSRTEFKVEDLCPKDKIVIASSLNKLETLGVSAFKLKLSGDEFGEANGPQTQVHVRPPWHNQERLSEGDSHAE